MVQYNCHQSDICNPTASELDNAQGRGGVRQGGVGFVIVLDIKVRVDRVWKPLSCTPFC